MTLAVRHDAAEIDMVVDLAQVKAHAWEAVRADVAAVRAAVPAPAVLKVICESALLTDDELVATCRAAEAARADFVKTSTGSGSAGGATERAVRLMADAVGGRRGVKASRGIRTAQAALAMVEAGASDAAPVGCGPVAGQTSTRMPTPSTASRTPHHSAKDLTTIRSASQW